MKKRLHLIAMLSATLVATSPSGLRCKWKSALANNLPIGSGEIESAHRYIVQKRLKLPGSWWCAANAEHMLALRLNRANR